MNTDYILIRSKRKTVALYVRNGGVEVRAPLNAPKREIDEFVASKAQWIADKLARSREQAERRKAFNLGYGDTVVYRDKLYPIAAKNGNRVGFDGAQFYMPPTLSSEEIKYACVQIYRMLAERDLIGRAYDFASRMHVRPRAVKISGAKTRWGSCSSKGSINLSWRLIMADDDMIDYIIVHELAHLSEMNHSTRFWEIVRSVLLDYAKREARLKELQVRLGAEDWE